MPNKLSPVVGVVDDTGAVVGLVHEGVPNSPMTPLGAVSADSIADALEVGVVQDPASVARVQGLVSGGLLIDKLVGIGDSRMQFAQRTMKSAGWATTAIAGVTTIGVLDNATNGTGSVDFDPVLGIRWSSSGTAQYGARYPATPGVIDIADALGNRLRLGIHSASGLPSVPTERGLLISGSAIVGYQTNSVLPWLARYFGGVVQVETWGIGGITAASLAGDTLTNILARTTNRNRSIAVVQVSTNDISAVSSDAQVPAVVASCQAVWAQVLAAGFAGMLIIEEHARFVGGTSTALPASAQKAIRAVNASSRVFAAASPRVRVVPTLDLTASPAATTLIPRTAVLDDGVHPSVETCQRIGQRGAIAAAELVGSVDRANMTVGAVAIGAADGGPMAFGGTAGLQVGTTGTISTGFSGQLSTGWTTVRQSGTATLVCSKVARTDMPGHDWTRAEVTAAADLSQWDIRIAGIALTSLGLTAGSRCRLAVELAINSATSGGPLETSLRIVEPNIYAQANTGYTGGPQTHAAHPPMWYFTDFLTIPAGSSTADFRQRVNVAAGGSLQIDIGRVVLIPA